MYTIAAPTYTYAQLISIINAEAEGCAASRKAGLNNVFTSKSTLFDECKNGLMLGKYKYYLQEALAYENTRSANLDNASFQSVGLSQQTITVIVLIIIVIAAIAVYYK